MAKYCSTGLQRAPLNLTNEKERFAVFCSRGRQNCKCGSLTLLFCRGRWQILLKCFKLAAHFLSLFHQSNCKASSETQGQLVGAGKRLNGQGKKSGEEKSGKKVGAPGILLLTDQFRNHLKSLPVIGHKNTFCGQSESSSFCVTFVTSYSNLFTAKHFACLFAILIFTCSCRRVSLDRKVPLKREP